MSLQKGKKVENIFPANDFKIVAEEAGKEIKTGLIIGYDESGQLTIFGGGMLDGRRPKASDWLWMVETFKTKLVKGDYSE